MENSQTGAHRFMKGDKEGMGAGCQSPPVGIRLHTLSRAAYSAMKSTKPMPGRR